MVQILDQIRRKPNRFRPQIEQDFFVLQLARRLGDISSLSRFQDLVEHVARKEILKAYRKVMRSHPSAAEVRESFERELKQSNVDFE